MTDLQKPTETTPAPRYGRLSVNINDDTANTLRREMTYEDGLNATEIVSRAIQLYGIVQQERRAGNPILAMGNTKWDWFGDYRKFVADKTVKLFYPAKNRA